MGGKAESENPIVDPRRKDPDNIFFSFQRQGFKNYTQGGLGLKLYNLKETHDKKNSEGAMASWSVRPNPDRAVQSYIVLCSGQETTLTVPFSSCTRVYKRAPANAGSNPAID